MSMGRVRIAWCLIVVWAVVVGGGVPAVAAQPPLRILFVGNSYTYTYDIPGIVRSLAVDAGFAEPQYGTFAQPSWFLSTHRANPDEVAVIDTYEMDVIVLQEQSMRPTNPFNPGQFKADATWFYDRVKARSPNARVVLYETWARAAGDAVYPGTYANPATMQSQLRTHYTDAAANYIPTHSAAARKNDAVVARVGDAWELELGTAGIPLHDADRQHPNFDGAYLAGLVLFETIYGVRTTGLTGLGRDPATAAALQTIADSVAPEPACGVALPVAGVMAGLLRRRRRERGISGPLPSRRGDQS